MGASMRTADLITKKLTEAFTPQSLKVLDESHQHDGTPVSDFAMPLNSTRVIDTPPGADVCWRREILAAPRAPSMGVLWRPSKVPQSA